MGCRNPNSLLELPPSDTSKLAKNLFGSSLLHHIGVVRKYRVSCAPFNVAIGNSAGYNYASGRLDHQVYYKSLRVQQSFYQRAVLDRIFAVWFREAALTEGVLPDDLVWNYRMKAEARRFLTSQHMKPPCRLTADDLPPVHDWMVEKGMDWAAERLNAAAKQNQGVVDLDETPAHQWFWDGHEHVDPLKEANAQGVRLANHTTTYAEEYARRGKDWEVELRQRAKEVAFMNALGLTTTPGKPADEKEEEAEDHDEETTEGESAAE